MKILSCFRQLFWSVLSLVGMLLLGCQAEKRMPDGKEIYKPKEFDTVDFNDPQSRYSYHRMAYTDNIVCFWEAPFGEDVSQAPDLNGQPMKVDMDNLLERAEYFYQYYRDSLHFLEKGSNAEKYRMMIFLNYSEEGTAYGGSVDNKIGALWVTPSRLQDPKQNAVAHELGHSFQAQLVADGLSDGTGGPIWEMTSQWMLWQVNPLWMTDENYHWKDFMKKTHLALMHPSNMYHSPYMLEYWADKHGRDIIGYLWKNMKEGEDPVKTYMRVTKTSQEKFNYEVFEAAQKFMTYDLKRVREVAAPYANRHRTKLLEVPGKNNCYANDSTLALGNYGYQGIRLEVPAEGTEMVIDLKGVGNEQNKGSLYYGLVLVREDGTPVYGKARKDTSDPLRGVMPAGNYNYLWLVVTSAPEEHSLDMNIAWNYQITLEGVSLHTYPRE